MSKYEKKAVTVDKELVKWLDQAFMSGKVTRGGVVFNGRLKDFPYRDRSGTLLADFNAKDVGLSYQAGWPSLIVNDADLEITGLGLSITSSSAKIYDSHLVDTRVVIDSFDEPYIQATSNYNGLSNDLVKFLIDSPVAPGAKTVVDKTTVSGNARGTGTLQLPLSKKKELI